MSMLAEKKRKQKWSLNPQGKHWLSDSNKFGLKILEGLGWKEGRGLGKQQDGITEPIKISYKNDNKGFGLKETQSSVQQEHFSNLLESLNNTTSSSSSPMQLSSLEEKSQNSRSRVHYKKFTRGKDLSRYSKKDLASIFEKKPDENVNTGSMTDYFKNRVQLQCEKSDDEERPGFGFKNPAFEPLGQNFTLVKHKLEPITEIENEKDASLIADDLDNACELNEFEVKRKSKKSKRSNSEKKQRKVSSRDNNDNRGIDNPSLCAGNDDMVHVKKKTKKKKNNGESDISDGNSVKRKKNEEDQNQTIQKLKKQADLPKSRSDEQVGVDNPTINNGVNDDTVHVKKKAKKKKNDPANAQTDISDGNSVKRKKNEEDLDQTIKKLKKQQADLPPKSEDDRVGVDNPAFDPADIQCDLILNVVEEPVTTSKPSKSNKKFKNFGCDNYGFDAKAQRLEENMASLSNTIETYQAEVENDMNECKDVNVREEDMMVGDFNGGDGENERREDGVLLRFKYASFGKDPYWAVRYNQSASLARKSYKHLIRGDITVEFKESNLHEIKGYGNRV